jgi:hypothetical protein
MWWFSSGAYWTIGKKFNLGIMARYSKTERPFNLTAKIIDNDTGRIDKIEADGHVGGAHLALICGFHWD